MNGCTQFARRRFTRLVGVAIDDASDAVPCVVVARLDEPREYHRFFRRARLALWKIWDDEKIEQETDDFDGDYVRLVDSARWIVGLQIPIDTAVADADADDVTHIVSLFQNSHSFTLTHDSPDLELTFHVVVSMHGIFRTKP